MIKMHSESNTDLEMVKEVQQKFILHWNYRGFTELPEVLRNYGAHIEELYLKWNQLSYLPSWTAELSHITNLYLYGNQIASVPEELEIMSNLNTLDLGHNKLEMVPRCIGRLKKLRTLLLNENHLKFLPTEMKKLTSLEKISVSGNELTSLPEWLGSLPRLEELYADGNRLMELPNRLTLAPCLMTISVCSNRLRYLCMNGFVSTTSIFFDDNPNVNYLSLPMSYQLKRLNDDFHYIRDLPAYRWPENTAKQLNEEAASSISLKIDTLDGIIGATTIIKLPRQILFARNIHENCVSRLWELALRQLYCNRFEHTMEVDHFTHDVKVTRMTRRSEIKSWELLKYMRNLIDNGPISICLGSDCQQPIFTETWIVVNSTIDSCVLKIALFCSRKCAMGFIEFIETMRVIRAWSLV